MTPSCRCRRRRPLSTSPSSRSLPRLPHSAAIRTSRPTSTRPCSRLRLRSSRRSATSARPRSSRRPTASSPASPSLNVGQFVAAGTTIARLVETDDTWVEANFKETQLEDIKVGQPATDRHRCLCPAQAAGHGREPRRRDGRGVLADPGAERHRQLGQGRAAHSGAHQAGRCRPRRTLRTGMSANVVVDTGRSTLDKMLGN